ncbi:hypothetical protein TNIN_391681 [Trichonephila inaurata madagascariensis]|uniref:Uncharacterized protein n=1 Tax=Trichonephila inaurata madagascariensis TaxID=2747483 RepID=A0A8X7C576_9ARAC|nr:hypothetical protein TNIN_391681 [Trichonephila inaurata madagascariensis]
MFLDDPETGDKKWTGIIKDSSLRSHWRKIDLGTGVLCGMPLMFESHPFLNETIENVFDIIRPQNCEGKVTEDSYGSVKCPSIEILKKQSVNCKVVISE